MPSQSSFNLPPDARERIAQRLSRASTDLFLALDEIREHGGSYLSVTLTAPVSPAAVFKLVLAAPDVVFTPATPTQAVSVPGARQVHPA